MALGLDMGGTGDLRQNVLLDSAGGQLGQDRDGTEDPGQAVLVLGGPTGVWRMAGMQVTTKTAPGKAIRGPGIGRPERS